MKKKIRAFFFFILFVFLGVGGTVLAESPLENDPEDLLYFSLIPKKNVDQQILELHPLLQLLEEKLQRTIKIIRPQSYQTVIEGILSRAIDFAILGPASYARARARDNSVEAFASFAQKKGFITPRGSYYNSVLFTLQERGFGTVADLKGKKVAFTDPASTSGSVIPDMEFSEYVGGSLESFWGTRIYTGSHDRSITAVLRRHVDAAFVSSSRIDEAVHKGRVRPDQVVILWRSKPIHRDPFVFSGGVDESLRNQIRGIMLSASPRLKVILNEMQLAGIVAVNNEDYQAIHDIVAMQGQRRE